MQLELTKRDIRTRRRMAAILRVLKEARRPLGGERIAESLRLSGTDLSERTVRNYLAEADSLGWTENLGRRGRRLTALGRRELTEAMAVDKVGYVAARVDELSYQMTFNPETKRGTVILNVSTMASEDAPRALEQMADVYAAELGMGRLAVLGLPGDTLGDFKVPDGLVAVGTLCSVSINGIFLHANIATTSRFGGLLELEDRTPKRFTQIIHYDGTSLDPLEIFIRGHMTSVGEAARTGSGLLGASFREVPSIALPEVERLSNLSARLGVGGVLAVGRPDQPLLDIPVPMGRAGLIVCGGLNPIAAMVESGIPSSSSAMHTLCEYGELVDYTQLPRLLRTARREGRCGSAR